MRSALSDITGIGTSRQRELLRHFGSVRKIREATVEDLAAVPGMGPKAARAVRDYFDAHVELAPAPEPAGPEAPAQAADEDALDSAFAEAEAEGEGEADAEGEAEAGAPGDADVEPDRGRDRQRVEPPPESAEFVSGWLYKQRRESEAFPSDERASDRAVRPPWSPCWPWPWRAVATTRRRCRARTPRTSSAPGTYRWDPSHVPAWA